MKNLLFFVLLITSNSLANAQTESMVMQKLFYATNAINNLYVDSVDQTKLVEDAIIGMLKELDPHSTYMNQQEVKEMTEPLQGNFDGIGVQFNMHNDTLFVINTIVGGPSEKVGILAGDRIIAVNDSTIAGVKMTTSEIMKKLRGRKGTKVDVTVKRRGTNSPLSFRITRDRIPIYSVEASYMAEPSVGYIKISRFAATTHKEFMEAVRRLQKQGMKGLIIDLQGNGGGYLSAATSMANEFLNNNSLIVFTKGRRTRIEKEVADGYGTLTDERVVILVDESSASASEILAGALQDQDRGVIVGRRTFGKGLVQRPTPLPDGSMIRLTISRYYTPSGRCIQKPYEDGLENYHKDLINRFNNGELTNADSIHFPDSLKYKTLNKKRTVYGGGGIMPDFFVPLDTTKYTDSHRNIIAKGALNQYVTAYFDVNKDSMRKAYPDFEKFNAEFIVTDEMIEELKQRGIKEGAEVKDEEIERSKDFMKLQLKALIARDLFTMNEYFKVINPFDDVFNKGLEIVKDKKKYQAVLK